MNREELCERIFENLMDEGLIDTRNYGIDSVIACKQAKMDVVDIVSKAMDGYLLVKGEIV